MNADEYFLENDCHQQDQMKRLELRIRLHKNLQSEEYEQKEKKNEYIKQ